MVVTVPDDMKFSDFFYLLYGAANLMDGIVIWQKIPFLLKPIIALARTFPSLGKKIMYSVDLENKSRIERKSARTYTETIKTHT
jgi:hypothetical protein